MTSRSADSSRLWEAMRKLTPELDSSTQKCVAKVYIWQYTPSISLFSMSNYLCWFGSESEIFIKLYRILILYIVLLHRIVLIVTLWLFLIFLQNTVSQFSSFALCFYNFSYNKFIYILYLHIVIPVR